MTSRGNPMDDKDLAAIYRHLGISEEDCKRFEAAKTRADEMSAKYTFGMPGFDDILKGNYYRDGMGCLEQDYRQAYRHYLKAAQEGIPEAMYNLGKLYQSGQGVDKRDYELAMKWYLKAANSAPVNEHDSSVYEAQNAIGELYRDGLGVEKDLSNAAEWFQKSAKNGFKKAENNLEMIYKAEPSLIPPLEKVKRDPQRKALILKNRDDFLDTAKKYTGAKAAEKVGDALFKPSTWPKTAKKITFKEMKPTKENIYEGHVLRGRIIDWPVLKASTLQTIVEDKTGHSQRVEISKWPMNDVGINEMLQAFKELRPNVKISIMNPHMKSMKGGTNYIHVESFESVKLDDSAANASCHLCGKEAKVSSCSGCFMAKYCSKECQKFDWIEFNHKKICKQLQKMRDLM